MATLYVPLCVEKGIVVGPFLKVLRFLNGFVNIPRKACILHLLLSQH